MMVDDEPLIRKVVKMEMNERAAEVESGDVDGTEMRRVEMVETFADGAKELTRRLLEMGIIFHDLLPYCKGDLILESQLRNLHAVKEPQHSAPPGIKPTSNPIQTPLEVIAITDALRKLKIDNLKYLLNGYELHESTSTNSTLDDDNHPVCCQRQPDEKATERDP